MSPFLLQPVFFFAFLLLLLISAVALLFQAQDRQACQLRKKDEALDRERKALAETEKLLTVNIEGFRVKSQSLEAQMEALKVEEKRLKEQMERMYREASDKEIVFRREMAIKEDFQQRLSESDADCARLKKELELSGQMHEGLKGQYEELEQKFSQLFEQFLAEQKKNATSKEIVKIEPKELM